MAKYHYILFPLKLTLKLYELTTKGDNFLKISLNNSKIFVS